MTQRSDKKRSDYFKAKSLELRRQVAALKRELKATHSARYIAGSAAMLAGVHAALDDELLSFWLSNKLLAARIRTAPFHLTPAKEMQVHAEVKAQCAACGIKFKPEELKL